MVVATNWGEVTALGTIGAAVGTVGAVLVALYQNQYREWRRRPSLTLERTPGRPCDEIVLSAAKPPQMAYYRLQVVARPGRRPAEDAEVMVTRAEADEGRKVGVADRSLIWSNTPGMTTRTIPPGTVRYIDVAYVEKAMMGQVGLQVGQQPTDGRHVVRSNRIELGLVLTARDAEPRNYTVVIKSLPVWKDGDEFPMVTVTLSKD